MDSESRELGVQLVEYVDGRYCYLDTHTGRVVCIASNGERMAARRVPPEVWDSVDRYYGGTGLGPMMVVSMSAPGEKMKFDTVEKLFQERGGTQTNVVIPIGRNHH